MEQTTRVCRAEGSGVLLQEEDTLEAVYRLGVWMEHVQIKSNLFANIFRLVLLLVPQ